jgi:ADP-heptose:LPS heptosyltransferase
LKYGGTAQLLRRNSAIKGVIEGKKEGRIEVTERRGRRRKQLLDDLKEKGGYWKFKRIIRLHSVGKSICKRLWTSLKTDYGMNE